MGTTTTIKPKHEVPDAYSNKVRHVEPKDSRTDEEIMASLKQYSPVTSEKNIWAFWDKGFDAIPSWNKRNVIQWVRMQGPEWTVHMMDSVPESPNYALNYVPADWLPPAFTHNTMPGPYVGPHSADFLRGACLYLFGGVFMDVGNILIRRLERICWDQISDPSSPFQVASPHMYGIYIANHFTASRKGDPFIKRWHDLFVHFWGERTNPSGLLESPLLAFAREIDFSGADEAKLKFDWAVEPQVVMEYITQVMAWARLTMLEDGGDGFSCADYWRNNTLLFNVLHEDWAAENLLRFSGSGDKTCELLALPLNSDPESEAYKQAQKLVWRLLMDSSMQKVVHGKGITKDRSLGKIWDEPENEGKDAMEGTFAELLRWGCVNLEQTREKIRYVTAPDPPMKMKKGVLEA